MVEGFWRLARIVAALAKGMVVGVSGDDDEMQQQMGLSLLLPRVDRIYALMPMPKKGLNLSFL